MKTSKEIEVVDCLVDTIFDQLLDPSTQYIAEEDWFKAYKYVNHNGLKNALYDLLHKYGQNLEEN